VTGPATEWGADDDAFATPGMRLLVTLGVPALLVACTVLVDAWIVPTVSSTATSG
jgi:hypothetical protein